MKKLSLTIDSYNVKLFYENQKIFFIQIYLIWIFLS